MHWVWLWRVWRAGGRRGGGTSGALGRQAAVAPARLPARPIPHPPPEPASPTCLPACQEFPNVLVLRVRMPIVPDMTYPRNFITKIIK